MNALVPTTNAEAYKASTDAAGLCRDIVIASAMEIQQRRYVKVEGWQAIAIAHGCTGSARDVERVEGGVRAIGEVRRMSDGAVIAEAEGFVGEDEPTWFGGETMVWDKKIRAKVARVLDKRPDYAIRAMAQTRAISRACRSAFAHVVVMMNAGLSTTPAEEVPAGGWDDEPMHNVTPTPKVARAAPQAEDDPFGGDPGESAVVTAMTAAINIFRTKDEADAWSADNQDELQALSDADYKIVLDRFKAKVRTLKMEMAA